MRWLKLPACKVGDRGFEPYSGLQVSKEQNVSSPLTRKDSILWGASDREVACSASDHLQEVLLAQFSLYVHECGLKPHSFHFLYTVSCLKDKYKV